MPMQNHRVLIANRGEIAIRIARACADLHMRSVVVYAQDDAESLHVHCADEAAELTGCGVAAYLDSEQLIALALARHCSAVHPGYGFLSESPDFARACTDAGLIFIGPHAEVLGRLGDKASARQCAQDNLVPIARGSSAVSLPEAHEFFASLDGASLLLKAISGGGGRGMRRVDHAEELNDAFERASQEALAACGKSALYCEELITNARHIEVQILGDGTGEVTAFGERECSLQRRYQKVIEVAPSPTLTDALRDELINAARRMARSLKYLGLGTFEFLIDNDKPGRFVFIEANPRLQVEHTVTEQVYGVDLVQAQIRVCCGERLSDLNLREPDVRARQGYAIQMRVNMERMQSDGSAQATTGTIRTCDFPTGPGVRIDTFARRGYRTSLFYDSLLAKVVVHSLSDTFADALSKARRALREVVIEGVDTNLAYLNAVLAHADLARNDISTRWLDHNAAELVASSAQFAREDTSALMVSAVDDTLELRERDDAPLGTIAIESPMQGAVVAIDVTVGSLVARGQQVAVLEAMKMQHVVVANRAGVVRVIVTRMGDIAEAGCPIVYIEPIEGEVDQAPIAESIDLDAIRPDLAESIAAHALTLDSARPDAIQKRHAQGGRSARENIADLVDADSFIEYGALTFAAQRTRHPVDFLRKTTPADGLVGGVATVNADAFGADNAKTVVIAYDYTVLAGTQGVFNHKKQDRLYKLAHDIERPVVLFAEGGGGRPGDTDTQHIHIAGLDILTFKAFAGLSALVPLVGVVHGRCFAGNAALLGCCDVIIATSSSSIGMGGPAMIEGGGLGIYRPEEVGPASVQSPNGVIDILVADEREATAVARNYLSYFQGATRHWEAVDQRQLRHIVPPNRLRAYDVRQVLHTLADNDSVLELRAQFGIAIITALIRIEGRPIGVMASNPRHLGGAIDADAADKAARFMQLCDAHDVPMLSLCDTPGFMVGPEVEKTAQVRHVSRLFVTAASITVPLVFVVLRKGYGLGAMAMAGGSFQDTAISVSWPSGEFGAMGLEGSVRLAFKKELAAIENPTQRQAEFERRVAQMVESGKALNMAATLEIDDVIDPADTRKIVSSALSAAMREKPSRQGKKRSHIDTW
jgi:acetyl/propionyl-CoA carboxylase alpha subunit